MSTTYAIDGLRAHDDIPPHRREPRQWLCRRELRELFPRELVDRTGPLRLVLRDARRWGPKRFGANQRKLFHLADLSEVADGAVKVYIRGAIGAPHFREYELDLDLAQELAALGLEKAWFTLEADL